MDLHAALGALVAPLKIGESLDGAKFLRVSTELGLRLTFEIDRALVHVEVFPADPERPCAARSARLRFAYRSGVISSARGQALCRAVAELARENERNVLGAIAAPERGDRIREVRGGALLEPSGTAQRPWFSLSPYVGCLIGCRFCYAQDRANVARTMRGLPPAPWGSYVDARVDAAETLERELLTAPPHPIKLCPIVADPYHSLESKLRLTRACLEVLRDAPPRPVFVLTRARLVERDIDVLREMPEVQVGFSIPTLNDSVRSWFEPRAASIPERLEVLREMRSAGVRTFAVVQPMLPGDPEALADALAEVADSVSLDVLRGEQGATALFDAYTEAREEAWQNERLLRLGAALDARAVPRWHGELPPL